MTMSFSTLKQKLKNNDPSVTSALLDNCSLADLYEFLSILQHNTVCQNLRTPYLIFDDQAMRLLAEVIAENRSLKKITIPKWKAYSLENFCLIAQALAHNTTLKQFYCWSHLADQSILELANALAVNQHLTHIDIFSATISLNSIALLSQALAKNKSLQMIDFTQTKLGDAGLIELVKAISIHPKLRNLQLDKCDIGDAGAVAFAHCLRENKTLLEVNLQRNHIGDTGIYAIAEAIKLNNKIQKLNLMGSQFSKETSIALKEACEINSSLKEIRPQTQFGIQIQKTIKRLLP